MSYNVLYTENFRKEAKRLAKKYTSLKTDIEALIESLEKDPAQGKSLGKDCFKIRLAIASKRKGKSGGARVITCLPFTINQRKKIFLIKNSKHCVTRSDYNTKPAVKAGFVLLLTWQLQIAL